MKTYVVGMLYVVFQSWVKQTELWFLSGHDGKVVFGRDPYSGDWTDTAQLNYWRLVDKYGCPYVLAENVVFTEGMENRFIEELLNLKEDARYLFFI